MCRSVISEVPKQNDRRSSIRFRGQMFCSLDLEAQSWIQDDQQGGQQLQSWASTQLFGQLHRVTDLWLVQLPSFRQDVPAQHTWHTAHRQLGRPCRGQRLGLVQHHLHSSRLNSERERLCNIPCGPKNGATLHFPEYLEKMPKIITWIYAHVEASVYWTCLLTTQGLIMLFCTLAPSGKSWTIITNMQHNSFIGVNCTNENVERLAQASLISS